MAYLIKSLKWTKHYGVDTWYRPNSNGYTSQIIEAGVYTEEDKNNPHFNSIVAGKVIKFIPIDQKITNKAKKQLLIQKNRISNEMLRLQEQLKEYEEEIKKIDEKILNGINNMQSLINA